MNRIAYALVFLCFATIAYGQNKTLGVGTTTPNPNAALHVESPTGNQGFIMPRLTTVQRNGMGSLLTATDEGVMVYDTDMGAIQVWNGSAWMGLTKLQYPYVDTVTSLPAGSNAFRIVYNSTDVGNFGVAHFENMNPNSGFTPLFVRTNSATNGATDMVINNATNANDVIGATTNGLGTAGSFRVNNAANDSSALQAMTNGTGQAVLGMNTGSANAGLFVNTNPASTKHALHAKSNGDTLSAAVFGENTGNGFGLYGKASGSDFASAAVYGEHAGTGDAAGAFRISNPANTFSGLYGETNGSGPAIFANNIGTGRGAQVQINNASNNSAALRAFTSGTGNAGFFTINNAANDSSALYIQTNGTGNAITANAPIQATQFIGDGSGLTNLPGFSLPFSTSLASGAPLFDLNASGTASAGRFVNSNSANTAHALYAESNGDTLSAAIHANNLGNGFGVYGKSAGSDFASAAVYGEHVGTGDAAGAFRISNPASIYSGLYGETNGSGPAIYAQNIGTGRAGNFVINNPSNTAVALRVFTNGKGQVANFTQTDTTSTANAIIVNSVGGGGVFANHNGGTGYAGVFQNIKTSNSNAALYAEAVGAGPSVWALKSTDATAGDALMAENWMPTGSAATFAMTDASNTASVLNITTASSGNAITANAPIQATQFIGDGSGLTNINATTVSFPLVDTVTTAPNGSTLLNVVTNSASASDTVAVAQFVNLNSSAFSNVARVENAGSGAAFIVTSNGTGSGGVFNTLNAANTLPALRSSTSGSGDAFRSSTTGAGSAGYFLKNGPGANKAAVWGDNMGIDGYAGIFQNIDSANSKPALFAEAIGAGASIWAIKSTDSWAGDALLAENARADGSAGNFMLTDASNSSPAVNISTAGPGNAITANAPIQATQFIGDGSALTGIPLFSLPRVDSVATSTGTNDLLAIKYNNAEPKRVLRIESMNPSNGSSAVSVRNDGWGLGLYVQNANDTSSSSTIFATTNSNAGGILAPVAVYGESTGTGSLGGVFRISNAANAYPAFVAETNGDGGAVRATTTGASSGSAGYFEVASPTNSAAAVYGRNDGIGAGVLGYSSSSGSAVEGSTDGTGHAGYFVINSAANDTTALVASTAGTGKAAHFEGTNATSDASTVTVTSIAPVPSLRTSTSHSNGMAAEFVQEHPTNSAFAINVDNQGTGGAGYFSNFNPSSFGDVVYATTSGTGTAVKAINTGSGIGVHVQVSNPSNVNPAVEVMASSGGAAGYFQINNGSNGAVALTAATNGTGTALQAMHTNDGLALDVATGGLKLSVLDITSLPATQDAKAAIYNVTVAGTLTLGTTGRVTGETVFVTSEVGGLVTVDGLGSGGTSYVTLNQYDTKTFTFINGTWRCIGMTAP